MSIGFLLSLLSFPCFFYFSLALGTPLTLDGRLLTTRLVILLTSLRPTTTTLLVTMSGAPYNRAIKLDLFPSKTARLTRLPGQEVPNDSFNTHLQLPIIPYRAAPFCKTRVQSHTIIIIENGLSLSSPSIALHTHRSCRGNVLLAPNHCHAA